MNTEEARKEHLEKYGSILYCPERQTLCSFRDGMWMTGCERESCILDDPEYQALMEKQKRFRQKQVEEEQKRRLEEQEAERIRDQRNQIQNYINRQLAEIHRLEEQSQRAYRNNWPKRGDDLFGRARRLRGELRQYMNEHGIR